MTRRTPYTKPPTAAQEARWQMCHAPLPVVRIHVRSYRWGGVHIEDTVPTEGRRVWTVTKEDEETFARIREGD